MHVFVIFVDAQKGHRLSQRSKPSQCICFLHLSSCDGRLGSRGARGVYGLDSVTGTKLIPICKASSKKEAWAASEKRRIERSKSTAQLPDAEDTDRRSLLGNSWSVGGAIPNQAVLSPCPRGRAWTAGWGRAPPWKGKRVFNPSVGQSHGLCWKEC